MDGKKAARNKGENFALRTENEFDATILGRC
jgi:hypothetical protein